MCITDREQLIYEHGTPAEAQHALEEHLLTGSYDEAAEALALLRKVCSSSANYRWRTRRVTRHVLHQAAEDNPQEVEKVLGRLAELLGNDVLPSILLSFNKPVLQAA